MEKKVLTMPIKEEDVRELKLGDVVYLTGPYLYFQRYGTFKNPSVTGEGRAAAEGFQRRCHLPCRPGMLKE